MQYNKDLGFNQILKLLNDTNDANDRRNVHVERLLKILSSLSSKYNEHDIVRSLITFNEAFTEA